MAITIWCMICNQMGEFPDVSKINFLYDDKRNRGHPICVNCDPLVNQLNNYNWLSKYLEKKRKNQKPKGIYKWL